MHMKANTLYNGKLTVINQELKRVDAIFFATFLVTSTAAPPSKEKQFWILPLKWKGTRVVDIENQWNFIPFAKLKT